MAKEYQFQCWECGGIYTTQDIKMPLCRGCQQKKAHLPREQIIKLYGSPSPTPLQAAKWRKSRKAMEELK